MKIFPKWFIILFSIVLLSCCPKKQQAEDKIALATNPVENGKETILLLKNMSLDTTAINGSTSYVLKRNTSTDVIHYNYEINMEQAAYDGGYREELIFEIPQGDFELNLADEELQKTKMTFGRHCHCRGQNGLFKITKGKLHLVSKSGKVIFDLTFSQDKVPQKVTEIHH